jgi:hypothetical protein
VCEHLFGQVAARHARVPHHRVEERDRGSHGLEGRDLPGGARGRRQPDPVAVRPPLPDQYAALVHLDTSRASPPTVGRDEDEYRIGRRGDGRAEPRGGGPTADHGLGRHEECRSARSQPVVDLDVGRCVDVAQHPAERAGVELTLGQPPLSHGVRTNEEATGEAAMGRHSRSVADARRLALSSSTGGGRARSTTRGKAR